MTGTHSRPSLARLTGVELRKAVDIRAGCWLLVTVAALTVAVIVGQLALGDPASRTLGGLVANAQLPISVLLPVVGLLSVTAEWSRRTASSTFTLVPARLRVVAAKLGAASLLSVAATAFGLAAGTAGYLAGGALHRTAGGWDLSGAVVGQLGLVNWVTMMCGTAFGLLLLHSAPAITAYYVLPIAWSIAGRLLPGLDAAAPWLDIGQARVPLVEPGVTGGEWVRLLTASLLWVAVPALLGALRVRGTEIAT